MNLVKIFLGNSLSSERLDGTDLLSVERYELKNRFRWFRWWIWQSTWRIRLRLGDGDIKFYVDCAGICMYEHYVAHFLFVWIVSAF